MSDKTHKIDLKDLPEAGTQEWTVYSFRLGKSKFLQKSGFQRYNPTLTPKDHAHIYHTHNGKTGKPNDKCAPVGGHFHKCEFDPETGEFKVGPALRIHKRKIPGTNRMVSKIVPVTFKRAITEGEEIGEIQEIVDDHTHEIEPLKKRTISQRMIARFTEENKAKVGALVDQSRPATQHQSLSELKDSAAKTKGAVVDV